MALKELLSARTREEVMLVMLTALGLERYAGLPVNDWHSGGVTRTISEISAEAIADVERLLEQLGYGGYLQTAGGEWLDELVISQYGMTRQEATFARGNVTFSAAPGVTAELRAGTKVQTASGVQFSTLQDVTLPTNGSITVEVQGQQAGSISNVASGLITQMLSPIPGVGVTNPQGWLLNAGADRETDEALKLRAMLKWPTLGSGMTAAAYEYWARTASEAVDQVSVLDQHPRGQGTLDVVIWGTGGIGAADVAAVDAVIQAKRPLTANVLVYSAVPKEVAVEFELFGRFMTAADRAAAVAQIEALFEQLARDTPIGGIVRHAQLVEYVMTPPGVSNAIRRGSQSDIILGPIEGVMLRPTINWGVER